MSYAPRSTCRRLGLPVSVFGPGAEAGAEGGRDNLEREQTMTPTGTRVVGYV